MKEFLGYLIIFSLLFVSCIKSNNKFYKEAIEECEGSRSEYILFDNSCLIDAILPRIKLKTLSGDKIDFSNLNTEFTLVNMWFLECPPCIEEIPLLNELDSKPNIKVISICRNSTSEILSSTVFEEIKYEIVPDSKKLLADSLKNVTGYPTNLLVNRQSVIKKVYLGLKENGRNYKEILQL